MNDWAWYKLNADIAREERTISMVYKKSTVRINLEAIACTIVEFAPVVGILLMWMVVIYVVTHFIVKYW
jgi:hypothetical protein